jgi:hypothetical protein
MPRSTRRSPSAPRLASSTTTRTRYVCPITQLYSELTAAGFTKFAARVANGEFDATKEESDEWAASPSGQEAAKQLSPEMREVLGLRLNN